MSKRKEYPIPTTLEGVQDELDSIAEKIAPMRNELDVMYERVKWLSIALGKMRITEAMARTEGSK